MTRTGLGIRLAVVLACLSAGGAAPADEGSAAELFRAGKAAYARKDYRAAATSFEAAFREHPHPAAKYNAAIAWELAGEPVLAADAFDQALASDGLTSEQSSDAKARLAKLAQALARVDVTAPEGSKVSVDRGAPAVVPARLHAVPGEVVVRLEHADGTTASRRIEVGAGKQIRVSFGAPPAKPEAPPRAPAAPVVESSTSPFVVAGWASVGAGAVCGVIAGVFGGRVASYNSQGLRTNEQEADAAADADRATVFGITAVALGVAGVVLIVAAPSAPKAARVLPSPRGVAVRF